LIRGNQEFIRTEVFANLAVTNIFLCSNNSKLKKLMGDLPTCKSAVYIEIIAGIGDDRYMHDLNAIASVPIFNLHLKQTSLPPFVPIAGICFAQDIATKALLALWELESEAQEVFR